MNLSGNPLRQIAVLLAFCCLLILHAPAAVAQNIFTYTTFPNPTSQIQTNGDARTGVDNPLASPNTVLQITPAAGDLVGSAWFTNSNPVANGFSTTFKFQFSNPGGIGAADGFAFVVQNGSINGTSGASALAPYTGRGGDLGFTGLSNSVAIEFDTYYNQENGDIAAAGGLSSADQLSIMSCGAGANAADHTKCQVATVDLSRLAIPIYLADGNVHTATINFIPLGSCTANCNNVTINLDTQAVLTATFDITTLQLPNGSAFVGFTGATGGGWQEQDIFTWAFNQGQTGTPIDPSDPASLAQTFTVSDIPGSMYTYTPNYLIASQNPGGLINPNSTPQVTPLQVAPADWPTYVAGTPFATTSCIGVAGAGGNCVGIRQLCTTPSNLIPSGANCPQSSTEDILVTVFLDPSTPYTNSTVFGTVEGNDNWPGGVCTFGTSIQTDPDFNKPCPQNGLGSFTGPGGNTSSTPAKSYNSTYFQVVGVLPPSTTPTGFVNGNGWTNGLSVTGLLTAVPPALPQAPNNNMVLAPIDSITYILLPAGAPPPDPTLPIPGSTTVFNQANSNPGGTDPTKTTCANTITPSTPTGPYQLPVSLAGPLAQGTYDLYYYTTDCAGTHERSFTFASGPVGWSTSLKLFPIKVDTTPPNITIAAPANGGAYTANSSKTSLASYTCVDPMPGSGNGTCVGTVGSGSAFDTKPTGVTTPKTFTVNATDAVGNPSSQTVSYSVSCHYVAFAVNPTTVSRGGYVNLNTSIVDCSSASQKLTLQFVLTAPQGKSCSVSSTSILTTPPFTIPAGTSQSFGFPLLIPKSSCAGTYTFTTNTSIKGTKVDSTTVVLTVK